MTIRKTKAPTPLTKSETTLLRKLMQRAEADILESLGWSRLQLGQNPAPTFKVEPPKDRVDSLIDSKAQTAGNFNEYARVTNQLQSVLREHSQVGYTAAVAVHNQPWLQLTYVKRQALINITQHLGEIINGDSDSPEPWRGLQIAARLVETNLPVLNSPEQ